MAKDFALIRRVVADEYTPTVTGVINVDTVTATRFYYTRIGRLVSVWGRMAIDPTATGDVEVDITLPLATNFTTTSDCLGVAATGGVVTAGTVLADTADDVAVLRFVAVDTTSRAYVVAFTYEIQE